MPEPRSVRWRLGKSTSQSRGVRQETFNTMPQKNVSNEFGIFFRPELWSPLERFQTFVGKPFAVNYDLRRGAKAVSDHLRKFEVLAGLANRLAEDLHLDNSELEARGYTPAIRSKEYAAIVEALITTLYSALDGLRQTIYGAYQKVKRVQNSSNQKMFRLATERLYGEGFPEPICEALAHANATWFPELSRIRTELIHSELGSCHWDAKTEKIFYMHSGLGSASRAHLIDDVPKMLSEMYTNVNGLIQHVLSYLANQLAPIEKTVICGIYRGRVYQRMVTLTPDMTFHSGFCKSRQWFDKAEEQDKCPLRGYCGAYGRVGPPPLGDPRPPSELAVTPDQRFELTQKLAYRLWEGRGRPLWDDQRDWIDAESRLFGSDS